MTPIREKALRCRFFARVECLKLGHMLRSFTLDEETDSHESHSARCMSCSAVCTVEVKPLETIASLTGGWTRCRGSEKEIFTLDKTG